MTVHSFSFTDIVKLPYLADLLQLQMYIDFFKAHCLIYHPSDCCLQLPHKPLGMTLVQHRAIQYLARSRLEKVDLQTLLIPGREYPHTKSGQRSSPGMS